VGGIAVRTGLADPKNWVETAALGLVSAGVGLIYIPAALIVAGTVVFAAVEVRG
jgi:hypothetical protein